MSPCLVSGSVPSFSYGLVFTSFPQGRAAEVSETTSWVTEIQPCSHNFWLMEIQQALPKYLPVLLLWEPAPCLQRKGTQIWQTLPKKSTVLTCYPLCIMLLSFRSIQGYLVLNMVLWAHLPVETVCEEGTVHYRASSQQGRPISVVMADVTFCGGDISLPLYRNQNVHLTKNICLDAQIIIKLCLEICCWLIYTCTQLSTKVYSPAPIIL